MTKKQPNIRTLSDLKDSGYKSRPIKRELRENLVQKLQSKDQAFAGILGFDDTVLPDLERSILSEHNILLLGLRGQAKTRIARALTHLLDEWVPIVAGSEIMDDPLQPISRYAVDRMAELGDETPIQWVHRDERYVEKLATPDVSVADLIGDVDPIKAATMKLPYSDERVIHFGLVPRAHRSIFVINELPDLQARIQVSLFNILQEGDLQIRGFKLRLPLDIQFVFTANPEDYTNRGSIVTPLKDRIESQILTHYPRSIAVAKAITNQEARIRADQQRRVHVPEMARDLLEMIAFKARESEYIDEKSGVSARLSISAYENLVSTAERRMLVNGETSTTVRVSDFWGVIPAITGKVELVYEGEQEGPYGVALRLQGDAIRDLFLDFFPNPETEEKREKKDPFGVVRAWFASGNTLDLMHDDAQTVYEQKLEKIAGLAQLIKAAKVEEREAFFMMELVLHGLTEFDVLTKQLVEAQVQFSDPLANMWDDLGEDREN